MNEQIRIGDRVTITVLKTRGRTVSLGIEAPREVRVVRGELPPEPPSTQCPLHGNTRQGEDKSDGNRRSTPTARRGCPQNAPASHPDRWSMSNMKDRVRRVVQRMEGSESRVASLEAGR